MAVKEVVADKNLIARCGLYCGACGSYLKGRCQGCAKNEKATWCKVRQCTMSHNYLSCADCTVVKAADCKMLNNNISKLFALIFGSNRPGAIEMIKSAGYEGFAVAMAGQKRMTPRRGA